MFLRIQLIGNARLERKGSKVGGLMSRIESWNEVVDRVIARLSKWKMKTLSIRGSSDEGVTSLGIYSLLFFNGNDPHGNKPSWVKWKNVLASKEKGGLGVSSLYALNRGLMLKWVWRFIAQSTSLWAQVIKAIHGDDRKIGKNVKSAYPSIWLDIVHEDVWRGDTALKHLYPRMYALESCKSVDVASKLSHLRFDYSFRRAPTGGAEQDQFIALTTQLIDEKMLPEVAVKTRWIKAVPIKVNVHAWKVSLDCLPTRLNISRRAMGIDSIICPMCDNAVESTSHLFFTCHIAREIFHVSDNDLDLDLNLNKHDRPRIAAER
ncbi:RNA-directed DNA polymerase, eukaryota, reverse transcriptase zinc-binding domain protein [Tanacetum coccineum]